jgi:GT2 family glycosyltransferase
MNAEPITATVVNYNGVNAIEACLHSLQNLEPPPNEIIVVDDASQDGSRELVQERFPSVKLVPLPENLGPCVARNRGLMEARTRLVFQVDGDVIVAKDAVFELERALRERPLTVLAQPRVLFDSDRSRIHYDGAFFHFVGVMTLRHFYARVEDADSEVLEVDAAISAALLVDREEVLSVGGYDPTFFILYEDHDLSYRLRLRGKRIIIVPSAVVYHKEGTAGLSYRKGPRYPSRRIQLQNRNRWIVLYKNHSTSTLLLSLPAVILFELVWFFFALRQRAALSYFRGKGEALLLLPKLRAARKDIQKSRRVPDRELLCARPLTFTPLIERGPVGRFFERLLNACLRGWWALVRRFVG